MSEDEVDFGLVMPFVVCQSQGGPYEDEAFCAGWSLGLIAAKLSEYAVDRVPMTTVVRTPSLPQVELLAMQHGYLTAVEHFDGAPDEWSTVTFVVPALEEV